ncbi:hypothetical protein CLOM_g746 [Closterium sp. NIES-68]|nr:hypothetical protein CLOM_g746 [Closterium sp. NIES-68]
MFRREYRGPVELLHLEDGGKVSAHLLHFVLECTSNENVVNVKEEIDFLLSFTFPEESSIACTFMESSFHQPCVHGLVPFARALFEPVKGLK